MVGFLSHACITIKADKLAAGIESENKSHELRHKWKIVVNKQFAAIMITHARKFIPVKKKIL